MSVLSENPPVPWGDSSRPELWAAPQVLVLVWDWIATPGTPEPGKRPEEEDACMHACNSAPLRLPWLRLKGDHSLWPLWLHFPGIYFKSRAINVLQTRKDQGGRGKHEVKRIMCWHTSCTQTGTHNNQMKTQMELYCTSKWSCTTRVPYEIVLQ